MSLLDLCLKLAQTLKLAAVEYTGNYTEKVSYAATGDATYEVDVPLEAAVEEYFSSLNTPCRVLTEDRGAVDYGKPEYVFMVDPLDGSRNARRQLPFHCCSIAAYELNAVELSQASCAVVERFDADEEFTAVRGGGARLNGEQVNPSGKETLDDAVLALGSHFAGAYQMHSKAVNAISHFTDRVERSVWVKCYGATALELAYLAAGRIDLLLDLRAPDFTAAPKTYDVAAGILLCSEAGACLEYGGSYFPENLPLDPELRVQLLGAGNRKLFNILQNTLR